jgi:uncharacterized protein (TIGR03435 family)
MKAIAISLILCAVAMAQVPSFEAATIKRAGVSRFTGFRGGPGTPDPGQLTGTNVSLSALIEKAYDLHHYQIKGPSWLESEQFDILARVPKGATDADVKLMLQSLLADRFKLTGHRETKEMQAYELVVDKGGPKVKAVESYTPPPGAPEPDIGHPGGPVVFAPGRLRVLVSANVALVGGRSQPISALCNFLEGHLDRPLQDRTGLSGTYDFTLDFAPTVGRLPVLGPAPPDNEPRADVFSAIREQLGLRLVAATRAVEVLVIDRAEKVPVEN